MDWVRLYTTFHDHRKTVDLTCVEVGLWTLCLSWSGNQETDGLIPRRIAMRFLGGEDGAMVFDRLVRAGLWEEVEGGFQMHDYGGLQRTAAEHGAVRSMKATAGRAGARARWQTDGTVPSTVPSTVNGTADGRREEKRTEETRTEDIGEESPNLSVESGPRLGSDVATVWDRYKTVTGRTAGYAWTPKRRRLISSALKRYTLDEVLDAVEGWREVPWNRGDNPMGRPYCELELLLSDAQHIERFRDAKRGTGPARPADDYAWAVAAAEEVLGGSS